MKRRPRGLRLWIDGRWVHFHSLRLSQQVHWMMVTHGLAVRRPLSWCGAVAPYRQLVEWVMPAVAEMEDLACPWVRRWLNLETIRPTVLLLSVWPPGYPERKAMMRASSGDLMLAREDVRTLGWEVRLEMQRGMECRVMQFP